MEENKQAWVYRSLRERIVRGFYGPGFRLVARALAQEFGTSTIPVREALRRLEAEGLVQFEPNVGATVTRVDEQAYAEAMTVLAVLEGYATALAAPHLDATSLAKLEEYNCLMLRAIEQMDLLAFDHLNRSFHGDIYSHCPNELLVAMIQQCWLRLDRIRHTIFFYIPLRGRESVAEHSQIIAALRDGSSPRQIEELARGHKLNTLHAFLMRKAREIENGLSYL